MDGTLWGRSVIDDNFRFFGIHELAGVARAPPACPPPCAAGWNTNPRS